ITGHANDRHISAPRGLTKGLGKWVLSSSQEFFDKSFVHNGDRLRGRRVRRGEVPTPHNLQSSGFEVPGGDTPRFRDPFTIWGIRRVADDVRCPPRTISNYRHLIDKAAGRNSGYALYPLFQRQNQGTHEITIVVIARRNNASECQ